MIVNFDVSSAVLKEYIKLVETTVSEGRKLTWEHESHIEDLKSDLVKMWGYRAPDGYVLATYKGYCILAKQEMLDHLRYISARTVL